MPVTKLSASSSTPAHQLEDWGPVGAPLGEPICKLRGVEMRTGGDEAVETGIWECTPGRYRRQIRSPEMMHILSGEAVFQSDSGETLSLSAGDVFYFPAETLGEWEIRSTVRKVFVLFKPDAGLAPPAGQT